MNCNDWNFLFQLIGAIGSIATFGAFLFLFFKDKGKQEQLDKLAGIVGELKDHTKLLSDQIEVEKIKINISYAPFFIITSYNYNGTLVNDINLNIKNTGKQCEIKSLIYKSEDFTFHPQEHKTPFHFDENAIKVFVFTHNNRSHKDDSSFELNIFCTDKLQNDYKITINYKKGIATITKENQLGLIIQQ